MNAPLRLCLTALVLVNLAFVHATEDASLSWLLPLYAVAVGSCVLARVPRFSRVTEHVIYRWTWNLAVVAVFALLVRHTTSAGPRHLLEDGLRLAAVCQVHLLSNLGTKQKPDLLFFNSFLIAVVTAFLTQDVAYSAVFFAFAPLFVMGLALHGGGAHEPRAAGALARSSLPFAGAALALTLAVFLAWPRDFRRRGLVVENLTLGPAAAALDIGFTEDVRLAGDGAASSSDAVVLRARLIHGSALDVPVHWRGATQTAFDGTTWRGGSSGRLGDARFAPAGPRRFARALPAGGPSLRVELEDPTGGRIFLPDGACSVAMVDSDPPYATPASDGTIRFPARSDGRSCRAFSFETELTSSPPRVDGAVLVPPPPDAAPALDLAYVRAPSAARIAKQIVDSLPRDAAQHEIVEAMRLRLASRTDYLPAGSVEAAVDIEAFVAGRAGGSCEHFAAALVVMLRNSRIPARLVTGYLGDAWDVEGRTLTIRRRDAHAWVEVRDPQGGWYAVDPTPAAARPAGDETSILASIRTATERLWARLVKFDDEARAAVLAWLEALPARASDFARNFAVPLGLAGTAALGLYLMLRRTGRQDAEVLAYRACLRRLGLSPPGDQTPRETLDRASLLGWSTERLAILEAATRRHEAARYAGASSRTRG
jgi:transglutaminase-like putative cysteine protease